MEFLSHFPRSFETLETFLFQILIISLLYVAAKKYLNSFANQSSSDPNEEPAPEIQVVDYIESVDHLVTDQILRFLRVLLSICTACLRGVFNFIDQWLVLETIEPPSEEIPPNSLFAGIPQNNSSEGIPPNSFFEARLNSSSNSSFEGIPPNSLLEGIPPNSSFEGISQNSSREGIPRNSFFEGIPSNNFFEGIPPNSSFEGILQNSSSEGIPQNSSPEGILQNNQTVPAEVVPVRPKTKRPNLGRGEGLGDSERRNLGWNSQEGWWVRRLRSGKIYGHVPVSNIRSLRNLTAEVSESTNRNDERSQENNAPRMTSGDYRCEDDTVPVRNGRNPQVSRPKSLFLTSKISTSFAPLKGRVPKSCT